LSFRKAPEQKGSDRSGLQKALDAALGRRDADKDAMPLDMISSSEVERFSKLPLRMEVTDLIDEIDALLARGVSIDTIYVDLLAPAARQLGKFWEEDQCDFVDVTMGLWRLQEVLHEISARSDFRPNLLEAGANRALFLPMPGDQHFLGPQVLDDFFARAGWDTVVMIKPLRKELLDLLSTESFDVVGLTLSRDCPSAAVRNIIKAMRSVSRNEHVSILVGGHMINQNPAIVTEVGADGTGTDARSALEVAEALVRSSKVRAQTLR
jgi:MerR family transcriptional regulator, light-induced transcriptional regulator